MKIDEVNYTYKTITGTTEDVRVLQNLCKSLHEAGRVLCGLSEVECHTDKRCNNCPLHNSRACIKAVIINLTNNYRALMADIDNQNDCEEHNKPNTYLNFYREATWEIDWE